MRADLSLHVPANVSRYGTYVRRSRMMDADLPESWMDERKRLSVCLSVRSLSPSTTEASCRLENEKDATYLAPFSAALISHWLRCRSTVKQEQSILK